MIQRARHVIRSDTQYVKNDSVIEALNLIKYRVITKNKKYKVTFEDHWVNYAGQPIAILVKVSEMPWSNLHGEYEYLVCAHPLLASELIKRGFYIESTEEFNSR